MVSKAALPISMVLMASENFLNPIAERKWEAPPGSGCRYVPGKGAAEQDPNGKQAYESHMEHKKPPKETFVSLSSFH